MIACAPMIIFCRPFWWLVGWYSLSTLAEAPRGTAENRGTLLRVFPLESYNFPVTTRSIFNSYEKVEKTPTSHASRSALVPRLPRGAVAEGRVFPMLTITHVPARVASDALDTAPVVVLSPVKARRRYPTWPR